MSAATRQNESHPFNFNCKKSIQAAAFLLKQNHETNKSDNYMRLLKLLLFADRKSLEETGSPITGDRFVAMKKGPTLSGLLDLVKQQSINSSEWDKYIQKEGFNIRLIDDPGNDELCRYEIELLSKIWQQYREKGEWDVAYESEQLPEFIKNPPMGSSKYISLSDILEALEKSDWLAEILDREREKAKIDNILSISH